MKFIMLFMYVLSYTVYYFNINFPIYGIILIAFNKNNIHKALGITNEKLQVKLVVISFLFLRLFSKVPFVIILLY